MSAPAYAQLHYVCSFILEPVDKTRDNWSILIKQIRSWVKRRCDDEQNLVKVWFFQRGTWKDEANPRRNVEVDSIESGDSANVTIWTMKFEHPCDEIGSRQWRIDVTVETMSDQRYRFSMMIRHWLLPGYIGDEPSLPEPTTPTIIGNLLHPKRNLWNPWAGSEPMTFDPTTLYPGNAKLFKNVLESEERECSVVYISCSPVNDKPLIDPVALSRLIRGTGTVYVSEKALADTELSYQIDRNYECKNGMVRIYKPGLQFNVPGDYRRHRFFTVSSINEIGEKEVMMQIVRGLCRRSSSVHPEDVLTIEGLRSRRNLFRLRELRKSDSVDPEELRKVFWDEVEGQEKQIGDLKKQLKNSRDETEFALEQASEYERDVNSLKFRLSEAEGRASESGNHSEIIVSRNDLWQTMDAFPHSLREVMDLASKLWPDKLVFTKRALKAASDYRFDDVDIAWRCIQDLATILHGLCFEEDTAQKAAEIFGSKSNFEVTFREGTATNRDPKFAKMRTDVFEGEKIDITPHLKYGNKSPKLLRIHFAVHSSSKKLIIGHVGDHLDNYSTRKKR